MSTTLAGRPRPGEIAGQRQLLARVDSCLTGWRLLLVVAAVYLAYALFVTWPLATNLSGQLSAPNMLEDAAGTTSYFADLAAHHLSPFTPGHLAVVNAPGGLSVTWALNLAQAPSYVVMWLLTLALGAVAGLNVFMLLGFVLSGLLMFAAVRRLFGSRIVALSAGFAFAFYPFAVAASSVHYVFVHGWPLLLCVWALIEMIHRPTLRRGLLAGLATAFAMWWNPYYELFGGFALATCLLACVAFGHARGRVGEAIRAGAVAILPVAALGVFFVILLKAGGGLSSVGTSARPLGQAILFSAHLRDYLLPGPDNLLFGHLTAPYLLSHLGYSDTWETALYPGYVVIALATAGFVLAARTLRAHRETIGDIRVVAVLTSGALAAVAFIASAPPVIALGSFDLWTPSGAVFLITPTWQTFARFVILLELALIIMMAASLARLRQSLRPARLMLVFTVIGLLLVVDLWNRQPVRTASTTSPPAYAWLHSHPGGLVADYPILPANVAQSAQALFWASYDGHPLFQGAPAGSSTESMKLGLANLDDPETAGKLAAYGVRYIVVHADTPGGSPTRLRADGYKPVIIDRRTGSLWKVTGRPAATTVDAGSGFDWLSGFPTYNQRLMVADGTLAVHARNCSGCTGTASFDVRPVRRALRLTVMDRRTGIVLARFDLSGRTYRQARVPNVKLVDGRDRLELRTDPRDRDVLVSTPSMRLTLDRP